MRKAFQHRLVEAVGGQLPITGKERRAFELEGPGDGPFDGDAGLLGDLQGPHGRLDDGGPIERSVPVGILRVRRRRARRATFRVGFAEDHRQAGKLGKRTDDVEPGGDRAELARDAHPHATVDKARPALGVKRDEVEAGAGPAGCVVSPVGAVVEEGGEERSGLGV